jgi:membrane protease YdiL (CAAX protease family)
MQPEADEQIRKPHRFRYLIDIVALVAATFFLDVLVSSFVEVPISMRAGFVFDAIGKLLLIGVGWLLIRLRGESLANIGMRRPKSWTRSFLLGVLVAALVFAAIYLSERAGFRRDLSKFREVQGNLGLTVYAVGYAFIGAGLYEEFTFRGFLFQGLAMFFGGSRGAWMAACIVQAALFGAAHAYQNPLGMLITGTLGLLLGLVVLACGRNLWLAIIVHGLYDASRFVLFYFQGPPLG